VPQLGFGGHGCSHHRILDTALAGLLNPCYWLKMLIGNWVLELARWSRRIVSNQTGTDARRYLLSRQKSSPPLYPPNSIGADRGMAMAAVVEGSLPSALQRMCREGEVVAGEIGDFDPIIQTVPIGSDQYVIEINTGLMDVYYSVAREIGGIINIHTRGGGPEVAAKKTIDDLPRLIEMHFRQWLAFRDDRLLPSFRKWFLGLPRIAPSTEALDIRPKTLIENLTTGAELFMIAHEFGHVAMGRKIASPPNPESEELSADSLGWRYFSQALVPRGLPVRDAVADAVFAIRILSTMESLGLTLRGYPPARQRVSNLCKLICGECPSQGYFDEACTIMVNYQELMDALDNRLVENSAPKVPDSWQARVRLIAILQEIAVGRQPIGILVHHLQAIAGQRAEAEMTSILALLQNAYVENPPVRSFLPLDMRLEMGKALRIGLRGAGFARV